MNSASQKFQSLGTKFENVGRDLSLRVTAPIVAAGAAITKVSADFETSLSKIVGLVGVSREQVNEWKQDILVLAKETAKAPGELADAMFFVTSAGLKGQEALDALEVSAKAAAAGLGETKVVADLVTSAMNAYGADVLSAGKATDILVATVREGKAEAPELAAAMGQVLPVSSAMGVSFDQVGAAIAGMTRTGTNAATASTQLRQILVSILKPSSQARDTLESLGLSASGLRSQIREKGLLTTLQTLVDAFGDNEEASAQVFGNVRALAGVMDLLGGNAEGNVAIFDALKDSTGALDDAFGAASETAGFKMQQALTTLKTIMIELGDTLLPMVASAAEKLSVVLDKLGVVFKYIPGPIKQIIILLAGFLAIFGPIFFMVSSVIKVMGSFSVVFGLASRVIPIAIGSVIKVIGSLSGIFGILASKAIPIAIAAVKAISAAMSFLAANPIVLVIAAIVALAFIIFKNWDLISEKTKWLGEKIGDFFSMIGGAISGFLPTIQEFFSNLWNSIRSFFIGIGNAVAEYVKKISAPYVWLYENIFEPITLLIQAIVYRIFYEMFNFIKDEVTSMVNVLKKDWEFIRDITEKVWGKIRDFFINLFNIIIDRTIKPRVEALKNFLESAWNLILNVTSHVWTYIKNRIVEPIATAINYIIYANNYAYNFLTGIWDRIKNFFWNIGGSIKDALVSPFQSAADTIEYWANKIREAANRINPFYRQSPSLVDNVARGIEAIKNEYAKLGDIRLPMASSLFGFEGGAEVFGGVKVLKQEINVNVEKMSSDMDVDALGRELGFRASLAPEG